MSSRVNFLILTMLVSSSCAGPETEQRRDAFGAFDGPVFSRAAGQVILLGSRTKLSPADMDRIVQSAALISPAGERVDCRVSWQEQQHDGTAVSLAVPADAVGWHRLRVGWLPDAIDGDRHRLRDTEPVYALVNAASAPSVSRLYTYSKSGIRHVELFFSEPMDHGSLESAVRATYDGSACRFTGMGSGERSVLFECADLRNAELGLVVTADARAQSGRSFSLVGGAGTFETTLPFAALETGHVALY